MSWIQTAYLIAEVVAIPLTGLFTRVLTLRWLVASAVTLFTLASIGCAYSGGFAVLLVFRVVQGFAGGVLIPAVFTAVFLLFPAPASRRRHHDRRGRRGAGADGRSGGRRLDHGDLVVAVAVPDQRHPRADRERGDARSCCRARTRISPSLRNWTAALSCCWPRPWRRLEIGLKQAPHHGWLSPTCIGLLAASAVGLGLFVHRSLGAGHPVVRLVTLQRRSFAVGCALSFCLGVGLFGSVYLMPVFLAFVRRHDAFEIGTIMLVTGSRAARRRPDRRDPGKPDRRARAYRLPVSPCSRWGSA